MPILKHITYVILLFIAYSYGTAQGSKSFFEPSDSLNKARFYTGLAISSTSYVATSIGLYNTWYKQFDQTSFHSFNDWNEWSNMDKYGHAYTAYNLANIGYQGARWTGLKKKGSLIFAGIGSTAIQMAIETMDGFSSKWGFSYGDTAFNLLGTGLFIGQEAIWDEQKIRIKMSSFPINYSDQRVTINGTTFPLENRIDELFGPSFQERFLKDYNAQAIWISANLRSFFPNSRSPKWLNVAFGFSGENMFGGFDNSISTDGGELLIPSSQYQRYNQYLLALDIDLDRIQTKRPFVNTIFSFLNIFKIPSPAIEYNSLNEWRFHLIFKN